MRLVEKWKKNDYWNSSFSVDPYHYKHSWICKQCKTKQTAITLYYYYAHKLHLLKLKKAKQFHPISRIVSNQHQFMWWMGLHE